MQAGCLFVAVWWLRCPHTRCSGPPLSPLLQVFSGHSGPVVCGAFTPDGKAVVTGGGENDCSLRVWNPKTGECTVTVQVRHVPACLPAHPPPACLQLAS
jgi:WD40 repeat protein